MRWAPSALILLCGFAQAADDVCGERATQEQCGPRQVPSDCGKCVNWPQAIYKAKPDYPRQAKQYGTVRVNMSVTIGVDGKTSDIAPLEPRAPKEFENAAIESAKQWLFKPPLDENGKPVKVYVTLTIDFTRT